MKIALVHDYIKEYGGAERVLETLHEIWPDAPVFTTVYLPQFLGPHKGRFEKWDIKSSFLQYIPFKAKLISPFRLIAPFVFKSFDLSKFDIVIVSATGAYMPNAIKIRNPKSEIRNKSQNTKYKIQNTVHVCYCHTPPRYLYGFATAREWKKNLLFRVIGEIGNHFLRLIDCRSSQDVDYFIANSQNVKDRIKKFYRREATVIYPPVDIDFALRSLRQFSRSAGSAKAPRAKDGYFLAGGRLARPKHIDLIVRVCLELDVPLKVFGREFGGYKINIKSQNSNLKSTSQISKLEFVGEVTDEGKMELMRNAKAYIFAAEDEDFGITPVEAMSVGTPVIAYKSGGVVESVVDRKTGIFFDELTVASLSKAIKQLNNLIIDPNDCIKQAGKFSKERFKREIKKFIESRIKA